LNNSNSLLADRRTLITLLAASLGFFLIGAWLVLPAAPAGFGWDETWYMWMAEWFSGRPDNQDIMLSMLQARQYPPFFPFILSLTGDVLSDISTGLLVNLLFLTVATFLMMNWLVREKLPLFAAVAGGALLILNPIALTVLPILMAEPLFILLSVSALVTANMNRETFAVWFTVGLMASLSVGTRSAGLALVLALFIHLVMQWKPRLLIYFATGVLTGLAFIALLKIGFPQAPGYLEGFIKNLAQIDVSYLLKQFSAIVQGWNQIWGSVAGGLIAAMIVLPGLAIRLKQFHADALYVVVSLLMLIAWPFPDQMGRFLWVLFPVFLLCMSATFNVFARIKVQPLISTVLMILILLVSIPDGVGRSVDRLLDPPGDELNELSRLTAWTRAEDRDSGLAALKVWQQLLKDTAQIKDIVDNKFCIHSELPALVSIQAEIASFASSWNSLDEVTPETIKCGYYYMIPSALPGLTTEDVDRFSAIHQEIFRSPAPYDESGETVLGALFILFPTPKTPP
jgi:hypothetical protein